MMDHPITQIHWFGDHWCLRRPGGGNNFSTIVSESLGLEHKKHVRSDMIGISLYQMFQEFLQYKHSIDSNHLVIFCLPTCYRCCWFNEQGEEKHFETGPKKPEQKNWDADIANDYFCSYQSHNLINTLYLMCEVQKIKCLFVNSYFTLKRVNMLTPDAVWILPPEQCLAGSVLDLPLLGSELVIEDRGNFTTAEFDLQKQRLAEYFIPNGYHPNQLGNQKIAEFLLGFLKDKIL